MSRATSTVSTGKLSAFDVISRKAREIAGEDIARFKARTYSRKLRRAAPVIIISDDLSNSFPFFHLFFQGQRFAVLEEKLVLAHVLRNFSLESTQTFEDVRPCAELITRPRDGINVSLAKRQ